ncbi:enoyl-CoA hydratase [Bailinhaonella thermotolerans]|uniref:Enoyl-CoA hydratase n=2 Tax=Bailinhaonella thermotolerans TaxID=1070861 RepID=A0A3A4BR67_9ACTN|nr:enoyl-CoA hydratase-related protein [Bailinhaonella thermotolerans]RJL33636.1 enoyl-CoA hydratase [Bailinhaonella thermotolerans]
MGSGLIAGGYVSDTVLYDVAEGVATITLNRPDSMNALITPMKVALLDTLRRAGDDSAARAVLITGAGRAFCAGQDLVEHAANLADGRGLAGTVRDHYNPIVRTIMEMPKPVIAAVNGVAAGAGASLAFACDFRVASSKASFATAFAKVGLAPDTGASWTLQRLVGHARATELLLLGEPVDAAKALQIGLVNSVVPGDDVGTAARALALRLATGPTMAYGAIKRALAFASAHPLKESLDLEAELQDAAAGTDDHKNATNAFLNKEKPVFQGR